MRGTATSIASSTIGGPVPADHLYTVTVFAINEPIEFTYEAIELDLPLNASAEQAISHVQAKILDGLEELIPFPDKLWVSVIREDGDSCHTSMCVDWNTEDDE